MLDELKTANKVVGVKQLTKALRRGAVKAVFLAENADPILTDPIKTLAEANGVPVHWCKSMLELGTACGISVGAAAAATLR